jgi:hypothetical protein
MMRFQTGRLVALFGQVLFVVACTSSGNNSVAHLGQRMQVLLAPDIAAGRAGLDQLPDGALVTLPQQSLFPIGRAELDDKGRFILASVIQGLLDPGILRIQIADAAGTPVGLQTAQARAVTEFFVDYGLGPALQPSVAPQDLPPGSVGAAPPGVIITVSVISS